MIYMKSQNFVISCKKMKTVSLNRKKCTYHKLNVHVKESTKLEQ